MKHNWPKATAMRLGLGGAVDYTPARVGITIHVPCERGHHLVDFKVKHGLNPEGVAKRMLEAGWTIGRNPICPDCNRKKKDKKMVEKSNVEPITPKPSAAAGKARRLVYMALEEYYDEAAKAYRSPHSDASIANECGVSEALVKTIREESYGPLAEPDAIAGLRSSLQSAHTQAAAAMATFQSEVTRIENSLAALAKRNGWS